ncbi:hypothetical protein C3398_11095 [Klebsiella pneumoniae]|nr:hypothetical protein C3398_11095 [Klebsiella pneumoniae]
MTDFILILLLLTELYKGGEVMTLRGGAYSNGTGGGIYALLANRGRTSAGQANSGVRPVYYKP